MDLLTHCGGDPEDILFSTTVRNKLGGGAPLSLKSSVIALCKSEITVRTPATELET